MSGFDVLLIIAGYIGGFFVGTYALAKFDLWRTRRDRINRRLKDAERD